jgi:hypothetical protein
MQYMSSSLPILGFNFKFDCFRAFFHGVVKSVFSRTLYRLGLVAPIVNNGNKAATAKDDSSVAGFSCD